MGCGKNSLIIIKTTKPTTIKDTRCNYAVIYTTQIPIPIPLMSNSQSWKEECPGPEQVIPERVKRQMAERPKSNC